MALNNFGIVDAVERLYRGAQPDKKGYQDLWTMNVTEILTLNGVDDNAKGWQGLVLTRTMNGLESVEEVESIVADLQRSLDIGRKVFVHCTYGRDRTGLIIGAYRIIKNKWTYTMMEEERMSYGNPFVLAVEEPIKLVLHAIAKKRGLDK